MPTAMDLPMDFHMDHPVWAMNERETLAQAFGWYVSYDPTHGPSLLVPHAMRLSTGEEIVRTFLQSPQLPVDFTKLDPNCGTKVLNLLYRFWNEIGF